MCSCVTNELTGQLTEQTRSVERFTTLELSVAAEVILTQDSSNSLRIEADKGALEHIETRLEGEHLTIRARNSSWNNLGEIKIYVTMSDILGLSVTGSGTLRSDKPVYASNLDLQVSGSGQIQLRKVEAPQVNATVTGSGSIDLAGTGSGSSELNLTITGSGEMNTESFAVDNVSVTITGSGSARIRALKNLDTNITGSGDVLYKGEPVVNATSTGSGTTRHMGD